MRIASVCLLLYWAAIFVGTHLPGSTMPKVGNDKLLHFGAFAGLAFLISWAFPKHIGTSLSRGLWTFAFVAGYAMVDELTQMLVPRRTCDFYDFLADACGAAAGIGAYLIAKSLLTRFGAGRSLITTLSR